MSPGGLKRRWRTLVLIAVTLCALVALDWWQANREFGQFLDAVEYSEQQMVDGYDELERTIDDSDFAKLDDFAPQFERDQAVLEVRADVSEASGTAAAGVQEAGAEVEDVIIMPWHRSMLEARDAQTDHIDAWVKFFKATAAEPSKMEDNVLSADIAATFGIAKRRVEEALPPFALHGAAKRVDAIFAE